jgi:hypothetical protein
MESKKEMINYPFDDAQVKTILAQIVQMGEDIKKENISNLDELSRASGRITSWREYIVKILVKILKPSMVLSKASEELSNVDIKNNYRNVEQGRREIENNITEILDVISKLRENIYAVSDNQQNGKGELSGELGASVPKTDKTLLIRTDYSNEVIWRALIEIVQKPGEYSRGVEIVDNRKLASAKLEEIMRIVQNATRHTFVFIVDGITINHPEKPILVVDLFASPGQSFRIVASKFRSVENNLSIANLDFEDYLEKVDQENIYRG